MKGNAILLFQTTHETLLAEKELKKNGICVKPRIKPRGVSSSCGIGLETREELILEILDLCERKNFSRPGIFRESGEKGWTGYNFTG